MIRIINLFIIVCLLCACHYHAHKQPVVAGHYHHRYKAAHHPSHWWRNPELKHLIKVALAQNPGLIQTHYRLEQAALLAKQSFADLLPSVDAGFTAATTRGPTRIPNRLSLTGAASYELDIWGKNKADLNQKFHLADAAQADRDALSITLIGSVTENWLRILALREEQALINKQIHTNQTILDLQHKRYRSGVARALDVLQQKETLAASKALLPPVQAETAITKNQLAILLGQSPTQPLKIKHHRLPKLVPLPGHGLPLELIQRRPDIRAAWDRVIAADFAVEVAKRNRLPNINLNADLLTNATRISRIIDNWLLTLAASVNHSVFNGGKLRAEQQIQAAKAEEALASYTEVVLAALKEVEDNLAREFYFKKSYIAFTQQLSAGKSALAQAQLSYRNGDANYLDVLVSLTRVQNLERTLLQTRREWVINRIALYRSLGGPWPYFGRVHEKI